MDEAQSNRKELQEILDARPMGITIIGPDMNIVTVNEANKRFWNLDRTAVYEGMPYAQMVLSNHKDFPHLTKEEWDANIERCLAEARHGDVPPREERGIGDDTFIFSIKTLSNGNRLTSCGRVGQVGLTDEVRPAKRLGCSAMRATRVWSQLRLMQSSPSTKIN